MIKKIEEIIIKFVSILYELKYLFIPKFIIIETKIITIKEIDFLNLFLIIICLISWIKESLLMEYS